MSECLLNRLPGLYLKETLLKGKGVYCESDIKAEETIEVCPTLSFDEKDAAAIDQTNLYNYYFSASFLTENQASSLGIEDRSKAGMMAFGILSFCNHADAPNAKIEKSVLDGTVIFTLKAMRAIHANEEITISYGKVWFDAV